MRIRQNCDQYVPSTTDQKTCFTNGGIPAAIDDRAWKYQPRAPGMLSSLRIQPCLTFLKSMKSIYQNLLIAGLLSIVVASMPGASNCFANPTTDSYDIVFLNGTVYTMDAARSVQEALVVSSGKIVFVGSEQEAKNYIGKNTKTVDLKGGMVLPGFHDCHVHLIDGGMHLRECNLDNIKTREALIIAIEKYAKENPDHKWIKGSGWSLPLFKDGNPHKSDLDKIDSKRPIFVESQDYHSGWANSCALKLAGIDRNTKDPAGGIIERDQKTGEPTGTLRETAMQLVSHLIPKKSHSDYLEGLKTSQALANKYGITSIQDACVDTKMLAAYDAFHRSNKLTVKVNAAIRIDPELDDLSQVNELRELKEKYSSNGRLKVTSAKIFADGVIEAKTAVLLEPYLDKTKSNGKLNFAKKRLNELVTNLENNGIQVHCHAIGDGATRACLDAFRASRNTNPDNRNRRSHIAHLELIDNDDLNRFQKLNIGATIQPFWAQQDKYITDLTLPVLGAERSKNIYPLKSLADASARLVGGSDWPVSSLNPLAAIEVAITRSAPDQKERVAWLPHQSLNLKECLEAYTINGAYTNQRERDTGSLEPGKAADLVVLDQNLFSISPDKIHKTKVLLTMIDGVKVYIDESFKPSY